MVYNACRALVSQLSEGDKWRRLADVVAVAICDFMIWSDQVQERKGEPAVPLLSRWHMTEQASGALGLGQVRYAFLELPKLGDKQPAGAAETWAWLFRQAPELKLAPEEVVEPKLTAAQRKALTLASVASFTEQEREIYERVRQERWITEGLYEHAEAKGRAEGQAEGDLVATRRSLRLVLATSRGFQLSAEQEARIDHCTSTSQLSGWLQLAVTAGSIDEALS